jgi:arginase family enzyme
VRWSRAGCRRSPRSIQQHSAQNASHRISSIAEPSSSRICS